MRRGGMELNRIGRGDGWDRRGGWAKDAVTLEFNWSHVKLDNDEDDNDDGDDNGDNKREDKEKGGGSVRICR